MPTYIVEIDGKQYDIEGDRPPTEVEARQAVGAFTQGGAAEPKLEVTPSDLEFERRQGAPVERFVRGVAQNVIPGPEAREEILSALTGGASRGEFNPAGMRTGLRFAEGAIRGALSEAEKAAMAGGLETGGAEVIGHGLAAALPVVGPAAAEAGETISSGDVAGGLGQATGLLAPFARPLRALNIPARAFRSRAARQAFLQLDPRNPRQAILASDIAPETIEGLGVGGRDTLIARAQARRASAASRQDALRGIETPTTAARDVESTLRTEAAKRQIQLPDEISEGGESISRAPESGFPQLPTRLEREANRLARVQEAFGGEVPAGRLFALRGQLGEAAEAGGAFSKLPGQKPGASGRASATARGELSRRLKQEFPEAVDADRAFRVYKNATDFLQRAKGAEQVSQRGLGILRELLIGRIGGRLIGGASGALVGGTEGALAGVVFGDLLSRSAFWRSLRTVTYKRLADALNRGASDEAADILQRAVATFAIEEAGRDRARNRRAQEAINAQGEGVVAP